MQFYKFKELLYRNRERFKQIFDVHSCSFDNDIYFDFVSNCTAKDLMHYTTFGCIIHDNNIIFPAHCIFSIIFPSKGDPTYFYIARKGIKLPITIIDDDDDEIHISLTKYGEKFALYAAYTGRTLIEAY